MREIHRADERGESNLDWLRSRFSFSFADYHNPQRMGFGKLRVLNDDIIQPHKGFGAHPHSNMEIITIITEGQLEHKDSTGSGGVIKPGDVQVMSAGSGVVHSETNNSDEQVKLFQLWIETKEDNIKPRYDQKSFLLNKNKLILVVSGVKDDVLYVHQDAKIFLGKFERGKKFSFDIEKTKGAFMFVIDGEVLINSDKLHKRDALATTDNIEAEIVSDSYIMVIEVPM